MDLYTYTGVKEDMEKLEVEFVNGAYTPFFSVKMAMSPTSKSKRTKPGKSV